MQEPEPHHLAPRGQAVPVPLRHAAIDDAFWTLKLALFRSTTIADVFDKFEQDGAFANFDRVAQRQTGGHQGFPWFDGLIYETVRAAADFLATSLDPQLDARIDRYIAQIAAAQAADPDGYLNTYVTLTRPHTRWGANGGDQLFSHEEYDAGCLIEAAVHHYQATHKITLLTLAVRFAEYMCDEIGPAPKHNIVPSHSLPEEALLKLYQLLRGAPEIADRLPVRGAPERYRDLVQFWIDQRGDHAGRTNFTEYAQDHAPVLAQTEAVGHAVRATLLYTGLAALANETHALAYHQASMRLWHDVVTRKMYLTGGVGAIDQYEGFGFGYYLPSDGYNETCAAVGMAFWAGQMHQAHPHAQYADMVERVIYNSVLAGVSLTGTAYSYQNPLVNHGKLHRWGWHSCPCCPPMLLKLYASLGTTIYSHTDQTVYINQYIGSTGSVSFGTGKVDIKIDSALPWRGAASVTIHSAQPQAFELRLRVPFWCPQMQVSINGQPQPMPAIVDGYAVLHRTWQEGDTVTVELATPIQRVGAHPAVSHLRGRMALQRGPLIYCVEGVDQSGATEIVLAVDPQFHEEEQPDLLGGVVTISGRRADGGTLCAVPYYAWDNRSAPETAQDWMAVWVQQEENYVLRQDLDGDGNDGWAQALYRPLEAATA